MPQFKFRNLPNKFEFPLTKHEIREFIQTNPANFEVIEFGGLSSSESFYSQKGPNHWHPVCYLKADWKDDRWSFDLEVRGLGTQRYEGRREEIAQLLLTRLQTWIEAKLVMPEMAPKKSARAFLYFDFTNKPDEIVGLKEWD